METKWRLVRAGRSGKEIHLGQVGVSNAASHQFPRARTITFPEYYAKDVTCEICLKSAEYAAWKEAK